MDFPGFSLNDDHSIPPELISLLPYISGAKLKVLLVVLHQYSQSGGDRSPGHGQIETLTGLSRQTVRTVLEALLEAHMLERKIDGDSCVYVPPVKNFYHAPGERVKNFYRGESESESESETESLSESEREFHHSGSSSDLEGNSLSDSLDSSDSPDSDDEDNEEEDVEIILLKKLRAAGVYRKTARTLVAAYSQRTIERKLEHYKYALEHKIAQGPGWLVLAIKEDWPPHQGFQGLDSYYRDYKWLESYYGR